jgi:hypothetical protein
MVFVSDFFSKTEWRLTRLISFRLVDHPRHVTLYRDISPNVVPMSSAERES